MTAFLREAPSPLSLPEVPAPVCGDRSLFPELLFESFLAHAAISPINLAGQKMVELCTLSMAQGGNQAFPVWAAQRERLRASLAALVGTRTELVGLTGGCTRGITDVALALPWKAGDELLTFDGEFPANVTPWQQAAALFGGTVRLLPRLQPSNPGERARILEQVEAELRRGSVRYLAVSAVQFQTGLTMPLPELGQLCRRYNAELLIDGIQGCGAMPVDLDKLEFGAFFCGAHKWMLGAEGVGFMVVSDQLMDSLTPRTAGWLSHEEGERFLFQGAGLLKYDRPLKKSVRVFEGSTANVAGYAALEAGVDIIAQLGPAAIFEHTNRFHDRLEPELQALGWQSQRSADPQLRSSIVSYLPPSGVELSRLFVKLNEAGIRASIPDGYLRIAPHFANRLSEVELLVETVRAFQK